MKGESKNPIKFYITDRFKSELTPFTPGDPIGDLVLAKDIMFFRGEL